MDQNGTRFLIVSILLLTTTATSLYLATPKGHLDKDKIDQPQLTTANLPNNPAEDTVIPTVDLLKHRMRYVPYLVSIPFLIEEPEVCDAIRPNASLLIHVHSAPGHFKNRAQIRRSYGSSWLSHRLGTITLFFVGRSKDPEVDRGVRLESQRYRDIVMADYYDTYRNLTFKAVSALTWITRHCRDVPYVLKTDDDIFLNIFNVVRHVGSLIKYEVDTPTKGHIHCNILYTTEPMRSLSGKWYVSEEDYPEKYFPVFCSGTAYLMPGFLVPILHDVIPKVPFLWLEDVYVTGLLRSMTGAIELRMISSVVIITNKEYEVKSSLFNGDGLYGHQSGHKGLELREKYWKKIVEIEYGS